jgi:hypothetical protein
MRSKNLKSTAFHLSNRVSKTIVVVNETENMIENELFCRFMRNAEITMSVIFILCACENMTSDVVSTLRASWFVIWLAMILSWLLFSSLDLSVIVVSNSTFRALWIISTNDCVVKVDSSTIFWKNTFWNIRSVFLIDVVVSSFDFVINVACFEISVNFAVWINFEFSMKSMIDFDWINFRLDRFDVEKTESELWRKNSYDRDLKSKFVKDRIVNVISKFERAEVKEDAVNDRVLALSFKIRSTMLN